MSLLRRLSVALLAVVVSTPGIRAQTRHPITFEEFASARIVSDPQLSPDGKWLLYAVRSTDLVQNRRTTRTFLMPASGGGPMAFPDTETITSEARWSPDGKSVAYISGGQLWIISVTGNGERRQLTNLTGGASGPVWSPTGDRIAFVSAVYPECRDDACNAAKDKAKSESKVKAHIADNLLFRHWNAYDGVAVVVSSTMPEIRSRASTTSRADRLTRTPSGSSQSPQKSSLSAIPWR